MPASYVQTMKKMSLLLVALCLLASLTARAQDAAIEERVNKLNGLVQDLLEDKVTQKKQLAELAREIQSLREQQARPNSSYATTDDLKRLAEKIQEIDKKREADNDRIVKAIEDLKKTFATAGTQPRKTSVTPAASEKPATPEKGYEYIVRSGDTLSAIVQAYRDEGIKVTLDQVLKANPGLNPNRMLVGQKVFIPEPR
jgi:LysM repeat protein